MKASDKEKQQCKSIEKQHIEIGESVHKNGKKQN